jgi:2-polyprenyl-6-methoxyphenol hydroxylase-like FAD-dependent oxidoreductase
MDIIVAGGGLVGLSTAAVLGQAGHQITVLEQAPEIRAAGAGIGLWDNALHVFDRVGIGAGVRAMGEEINVWFFDPAGKSWRAPGTTDRDYRFLLVPRAPLNNLLADAIGHAHLELAARATGFTETGDAVTVHLADGRSLRGDLLIGADGVYSRVRERLLPGYEAQAHAGHVAWRAVVPAGGERPEGTVLTVGRDRTRGGYSRIGGGRTMWMVNQFDAGELVGGKRERALLRARNLTERGWQDDLLTMIANTPEDAILENRIMLVPPLPRWSGARVTLIGDAAHGLSPHLSAGGTLGIEDATVLCDALDTAPTLADALLRYERARLPRFARVREFAARVENAAGPAEFAARYAEFTNWMLATEPRQGSGRLT